MHEQALSCFLVLGEIPGGPEEGQVGREATLRPGREAMGPALRSNIRRVALGHRPGARRVHDQRSPAGNQPLVVRRIVPCGRIRRQESDQLLVEIERLPNGVGLDGEIALGIDEFCAERVEDRARGIHAVGGLAETDAEGETGLVAGFRRLQERVDRPVVGFRRAARRIYRLHVDVGVFLHQVDTGAGPLDLAADAGGNAEPLAIGVTEIFDRVVNLAVLLDDRIHDVVDGLKQIGIGVRSPCGHRQNIMARFGLSLRGRGQEELVALAGDVID